MNKLYEDLMAAKAKHADLFQKRELINEKSGTIQSESSRLRVKQAESERAYALCAKQHIRGEASDEELAANKKEADTLREQQIDADRMLELVGEAHKDIEAEIIEAARKIQVCQMHYCQNVQRDISASLSNDSKIREKLLEIQAAGNSGGVPGGETWGDFLSSIFKMPSYEEVQSGMAEFPKKHKLDRN